MDFVVPLLVLAYISSPLAFKGFSLVYECHTNANAARDIERIAVCSQLHRSGAGDGEAFMQALLDSISRVYLTTPPAPHTQCSAMTTGRSRAV